MLTGLISCVAFDPSCSGALFRSFAFQPVRTKLDRIATGWLAILLGRDSTGPPMAGVHNPPLLSTHDLIFPIFCIFAVIGVLLYVPMIFILL